MLLPLALGACALPTTDLPPADTAPVGAARIDITPDTPVRLYGYAARKTESEGVAGRLAASALAIGGDGEPGPAVLLSVDSGSVPPAIRAAVLRRLQAKVALRPEQLMLCHTHNHSGPDLEGMDAFTGVEREHLCRYAEQLTARLEQVVLDALAARRPCRLAWAQGAVGFATNRRVLQDGKWVKFGLVPGAPTDHTLPVLRVTDEDGRLRAILVSYACHNTTLRPNFKQVHGDWAGCAREYLEADFPGAVALLTLGCGADADPGPHGTVELCQQHGRALADQVKQVLQGPFQPLSPRVTPRIAALEVPFEPLPPMDELRAFAAKTYSAAQTLKLLEGGKQLPTAKRYELATWTFGDDLAMVFLSNEVVVDYALRLRRELDPRRLWVHAYTNEVLYYVASQRLIAEGGYESTNSLSALLTYGRPERLHPPLDDRIVAQVRSLLPESFRRP